MHSYSLLELAEAAQVTPRTIRFYIQQGLLPSPGVGPGTRYDEGHLARLRLIRELQRQHLPLAEIRVQLTPLRDEEVRDALESVRPRPTGSAVDYVRSVLGAPRLPTPPALFEPPGGASPARVAGTEGPPTVHPQGGSGARTPTTGQRRPAWEAALNVDASAAPSPDEAASPAAKRPRRAAASLAAQRSSGTDASTAVRPASPGDATPAAKPAAASRPGQPPEPNALRQPDRSQWERLVLHPDIELHIRRPLSRHLNRQVERLVRLGRQLLEEDQP